MNIVRSCEFCGMLPRLDGKYLVVVGWCGTQWAQIGGIEVFFISGQRCGYLQKLHYVCFNFERLSVFIVFFGIV